MNGEGELKMAEGIPYIESKPRASLNKRFMSLYCTNIDVYFDNKDVYNSKLVEGHNMHSDNLRHQDFGKSDLREYFGCTSRGLLSYLSVAFVPTFS